MRFAFRAGTLLALSVLCALTGCASSSVATLAASDADLDALLDAPADTLDGAPIVDDADPQPEPGDASTEAPPADGRSYLLHAVPSSAWLFYVRVGDGTAHQVQLDTGSDGLYVPRTNVGATATISTTETCSITYTSSGKTLAGHKAKGPIALLGATSSGELAPPPTTIAMPFCAVDDPTWKGGMMGVGYGRGVSDPKQNVLLQLADVASGAMHAGYVLSTHPAMSVEIGITSTRAGAFSLLPLTPSPTGNGDWLASSLRGCVSLPSVSAFEQACGGLLVDTGIPQTILWGPADPTLGGVVAAGATTAPAGVALRIVSDPIPALDYAFTLGSGVDSPSAVDVRTAGGFSINTGRAVLVDYDYLFDAQEGHVGFLKR
jgi:hypothetical protein